MIVGRNSVIWRAISARLPHVSAIGHSEIATFEFRPDDIVWIFSYSLREQENRSMFHALSSGKAQRFVYVSSATANVADRHECYAYPRAKRAAEKAAGEILRAQIVRLGIVFDDPDEIPHGWQAQTSLDDIVAALESSVADGIESLPLRLFELRQRPFTRASERLAYALYGALVRILPVPCLARPLDVVLRALGWRWYGYVFVSNRLWLTTGS